MHQIDSCENCIYCIGSDDLYGDYECQINGCSIDNPEEETCCEFIRDE